MLRFASAEVYSVLKGGGRLLATGKTGARRLLVTAQIALSLVLVISAVLFSRSLLNLTSEYLGFHPQHVLVVRLSYDEHAKEPASSAYSKLLREVRRLPGAEAASLSSESLFSGNRNTMGIRTALGAATPPNPLTGVLFISRDYFRTLGIRLLAGRDFELHDNEASAPDVVIVNEAFSRKFMAGGNIIGQRITKLANAPQWAQIVGIVNDTKYSNVRETPPPMLYVPYGRLDEWISP